MASRTLKSRLKAGETLFCSWISTSEPQNASVTVAAGFDAVTIDMQHGVAGTETMSAMVAAIAHEGALPIVRVPLFDAGLAGTALDSGAQGIIAPMINSVKDAEWLVEAVKFPPVGERSWGPDRACRLYGMTTDEMLATANDWIMAIPMIETVEAMAAMDDIMTVPGIDAVFVGPSDLSISLANGARVGPAAQEALDACEKIAKTAEKHGLPAAIFAVTPELARIYQEMGFRLIVPASDLMMLKSGAQSLLDEIRMS